MIVSQSANISTGKKKKLYDSINRVGYSLNKNEAFSSRHLVTEFFGLEGSTWMRSRQTSTTKSPPTKPHHEKKYTTMTKPHVRQKTGNSPIWKPVLRYVGHNPKTQLTHLGLNNSLKLKNIKLNWYCQLSVTWHKKKSAIYLFIYYARRQQT